MLNNTLQLTYMDKIQCCQVIRDISRRPLNFNGAPWNIQDILCQVWNMSVQTCCAFVAILLCAISWYNEPGGFAIADICLKLILNSYLDKSCSFIISMTVVKLFWFFFTEVMGHWDIRIFEFKLSFWEMSQIAKFMRPTWGPPGSCRPQMGPMLAPWTLLSGVLYCNSPLDPTVPPFRKYRWLSARLQYLQCISNGDTAVLH